MSDGREAAVRFTQEPDGVRIHVDFDAGSGNRADVRQQGWQTILDNLVEAGHKA